MQKIKTVWILLRSHVVTLPPIMTVIECLLESEGYNVNFISTQSANLTHPNLKEYILDQGHDLNKFSKIKDYIKYRKMVDRVLNKNLKGEDIVWLASLDTALACIGLNFFKTNSYILHLHELYDTHQTRLKLVKKIAQNAKYVVVPEENRAGILQVWLDLKNKPTVLPNKPYRHPRKKNLKATHPLTIEILERYKTDKRIIIYQGHIGGDRNLIPIAMAVKDLPDYEFWLLGKDHDEHSKKLEAISENIRYLGNVPAPYHLEITSYADIGIMSYDLITLNNLYCAPNKVWEYMGFNIFFICNQVKSLGYYEELGVCKLVDFKDTSDIKKIIEKEISCEKDFNNIYEGCDCKHIINEIVN